MKLSRVELAALNNAIWCDTVCRLHGSAGELSDHIWVNRNRSPVYYPNLVTLRHDRDQTAVLKTIHDLIGSGLTGNWAVKDSFQSLALASLGFDVLFEAAWVWHAASVLPKAQPGVDIRWVPVTSADVLSRWEDAWTQANQHVQSDGQPRMFPAPLLANHDVAIFAGYRDQRLIAGGIAHSSEAVVGLSNIFAPPGDALLAWTGLHALVQTAFPARHVVGYEHGQSLKAALSCGFEEIGKLSVWLRRT